MNCPSCRLTVYSATRKSTSTDCPRCGATLGKIAKLFGSKLPARFLRPERVKAS
jgi:ribosomal protein L34E